MTLTWVWTIIAGLGLIFAIYNWRQSLRDLKAVGSLEVNGARRILARASVQAETGRLLVQLIFTLVGAIALMIPHIYDDRPPPSWVGDMLGWGLVLAAGLIGLNTILSYFTRRRLRNYFQAESKKGV